MSSRDYKEIKLESVRNLRARHRAEGKVLVQAALPGDLVAEIDRMKVEAGVRGRDPIIEEAVRNFIESKRA